MTWVSCKDEMPPEKTRVLCAMRHLAPKILSLSPPSSEYKRGFDWQGESVSSVIQRFRIDEVTHWMPLPESPNVALTGPTTAQPLAGPR